MLRLARPGVPLVLIAVMAAPLAGTVRIGAGVGLLGYWTAMYVRYRRRAVRQTRHEHELLARTSWTAFWRHYNEEVPTVEEEFKAWGPYHQHRHEMRYDIVSDVVRRHLPSGGRMFDIGCGSGMVADRTSDLGAAYVGMDFGHPMVTFAQTKHSAISSPLSRTFLRGDAAAVPFQPSSFDIVVMSEVIEHLLRPELAVWEVARVLRPGGVFVMTTNNASEVPLRSPLSHLFAWIEKAAGATFPRLISLRPWVWPKKVTPELVPEGWPDVYLPHTHHIQAETRRMFAAAGMETFRWSTFEFPPPQSKMATWLERRGKAGRRMVDVIETVAQHTPGVRRLGTHVLMIARKTGSPVAASPPAWVWPGPLSGEGKTQADLTLSPSSLRRDELDPGDGGR